MIEVLISISIMATISMVSMINIDIKDKYDANKFVEEFVIDIRYIRQLNKSGNRNAYILYDNNQDKIGYKVINQGKVEKEKYLPKAYKLSYSTPKIMFRGSGSFIGNGETITIYKDSSYKKVLTIVPFSGRVLLREGKYE